MLLIHNHCRLDLMTRSTTLRWSCGSRIRKNIDETIGRPGRRTPASLNNVAKKICALKPSSSWLPGCRNIQNPRCLIQRCSFAMDIGSKDPSREISVGDSHSTADRPIFYLPYLAFAAILACYQIRTLIQMSNEFGLRYNGLVRKTTGTLPSMLKQWFANTRNRSSSGNTASGEPCIMLSYS